jgi:hypothetical protein
VSFLPSPKTLYVQATAVVTVIVGQVVAYVPAWRPDAQHIISAGSVVLAVVFALHDAIKERHLIVGEAESVVKVDAGDVQQAVHAELARVFAGQSAPVSAPAPASAPSQPATRPIP